MNILFTVCGRAGSKGIKGKNFREFLGVPLLYYTVAAIELYKEKHSENCIDIALNTDSVDMVRLIERLDLGISCIDRKEELAGDYVAKIDVIRDTWQTMCTDNHMEYDVVIDCDITSPLRTVQDIEKLVKKYNEGKYDIVYSVTTARRNPYFNMVTVDDEGFSHVVIKSDFVARQQAPVIYDMNASLYAYTPAFLGANKCAKDAYNGVIFMKDTAVLDLDNEGDFELMQIIAEYLVSRDDNMRKIFLRAKEILNT